VELRERAVFGLLSAIKNSIFSVKEVVKCLAYALIIAMPRVNGDPKYMSYRRLWTT